MSLRTNPVVSRREIDLTVISTLHCLFIAGGTVVTLWIIVTATVGL